MKTKITIFITGIFSLLLLGSSLQAATVEVVSPSSALPIVVTIDNKTDKDAAEDLCNYLSRVSGRKITVLSTPPAKGVIIHVGRDEFVKQHAPEIDKLFADGYIVKVVEVDGRYHIILAGRIHPSTQWAVEQFLKDYCGVRWLFPDPKYGEVVPSRPTITIDSALSKKYEPDYMNRANCAMYYFNPAHSILRLRSYGVGDYGSHGLQHIFQKAEFEAHPEWFAYFMDDGKSKQYRGLEDGKPKMRRQWWPYGNGWQMCFSNRGTIEHTIKYALEHFKNSPDSPVVSIGANDGHGWCQCSECKKFADSFSPAYSTSEIWWHWVNEVAKEVAKTYPDKWVEALAYGIPMTPPRFKLQPNVAISLTVIYADHFDTIENWKPLCKSINLYSYMYGYSFFGFRHYPRAARDFLKFGYDELGSLSHVTEAGGGWAIDGPKYHYIQALQWDVNADLDKIMGDFCNASYGKAAKPMRAFWDRLEQCYEKRPLLPYGKDLETQRLCFYMWVSWQNPSYLRPDTEFEGYTLEDINFLDKNITEAVSLGAAATPEVQFRIERMIDAWKYVQTMLLSKVKYYDNPPNLSIDSAAQNQALISIAKDIAKLRADRKFYAGKMRMYPHINLAVKLNYYWSLGSALTLFSAERTLLDESCTALTAYIEKTQGQKAAKTFWQHIGPSDNLRESAQTQLYMLGQTKLKNVLVNGDFESGTVNGWTASSSASVIAEKNAYQGKYCLKANNGTTLTQDISVEPLQRYRLTVWVKYLQPHKSDAPSVETNMAFHQGRGEPMRNVLSTGDPADGWKKLRTTATVPPGTTGATITLKTHSTVLLDNIAFELIKDAPAVRHDIITDTFSGSGLDSSKWFQPVSSGGTKPPKVDKGLLIYDDKDMYPLVSQARFNDLLKYEGKDRYRLRIQAKALTRSSSLTWGIKTGLVGINTSDSGMYWTHNFSPAANVKSKLVCYSIQNGKLSSTFYYTGMHLEQKYDLILATDTDDVWYTLYFDPKYVTIYVSARGYEESEKSLVATYEHKIKDITANGSVYLKLAPGQYMLDEISLTSPKKVAAKMPLETKAKPGSDEILSDHKKDMNVIEVPLDIQ
jgi:hypothetical protein